MAIAPLNGRPALTHVALGTVYVTLRHNHDPRPLAAHTSAAAMSTTADWLAVVSLLGICWRRDARSHGATRPAIRQSTGGSHPRSPLNVHQALRLRGFVTSSTTLPLRTVTLVHLGSSRVEDTTYLGRLFNRSAHSPGRDAHRAPNHSSLRRPSSRAAVRSASAYSTLPHSSRSLPPSWTNQPPSLKPSSPSGSWTTPSSETFVLITIFVRRDDLPCLGEQRHPRRRKPRPAPVRFDERPAEHALKPANVPAYR